MWFVFFLGYLFGTVVTIVIISMLIVARESDQYYERHCKTVEEHAEQTIASVSEV